MFRLLGHKLPLDKRDSSLIYHGSPVRVGRVDFTCFEVLPLGYAGFLMMFSFTALKVVVI